MLNVKNSALEWDAVKDSGARSSFSTGSVRDTQANKGRPDLIPTSMLKRLSQHYANGAVKYGDNNWKKGQKLSQYYSSAMRHMWAIMDLDLSEDHYAAAIWNITAMIDHIDRIRSGDLPRELDDIGIIEAINKAAAHNKPKSTIETMQDMNKALEDTSRVIGKTRVRF